MKTLSSALFECWSPDTIHMSCTASFVENVHHVIINEKASLFFFFLGKSSHFSSLRQMRKQRQIDRSIRNEGTQVIHDCLEPFFSGRGGVTKCLVLQGVCKYQASGSLLLMPTVRVFATSTAIARVWLRLGGFISLGEHPES